jgi:hypothetical protein
VEPRPSGDKSGRRSLMPDVFTASNQFSAMSVSVAKQNRCGAPLGRYRPTRGRGRVPPCSSVCSRENGASGKSTAFYPSAEWLRGSQGFVEKRCQSLNRNPTRKRGTQENRTYSLRPSLTRRVRIEFSDKAELCVPLRVCKKNYRSRISLGGSVWFVRTSA